ncbi:MAG: outer membrane beta-barrel protein [Chitinophagaceae bacterium]|nr:outer membrane beta-barrel protein [Chitinophagaceae bacterium]
MQHLLRKQIITGALLLCISFASIAQRGEVYQPFHDELPYYLGMSIGLNNNYLNFNRNIDFIVPNSSAVSSINPKSNLALNLGLIGTLRLSAHTLLRLNPTVLIAGSKNLYTYTKRNNPSDTLTMNAASAIINIPLAIKIESDRYNAFRFTDLMRHYVFLGGKVDFDLLGSNRSVILSKNAATSSSIPYNNTLNGLDYGYEMGLGVSFYLQYATISPEVKFSYGLRNLNKGDALLSSIRNISGNFVYFTIHIEN